ncbi:hypothetical protein PENTCL1PPCAC_23160 [Pristionchus entomophagus]|uniref:DUF676 domain-containing protein n=1 Tax=Pristionchus entomophagus TaxID=358040 RepID=A0AAV5U294_9BILA|nr:hypothetical protein PENTCL1PPCAC_23160 [Pristionchus entomophagus]
MSKPLVELHPFYNVYIYLNRLKNIELPYRGYWQVRLTAEGSSCSEWDVKLEGKDRREGDYSLLPACIQSRSALSKTVEVLYTDEEFQLADGFIFSFKSNGTVRIELDFIIELWFCDKDQPPRLDKFQKLNSRKMTVSLEPSKVCSAARLIHWDYGACASLTLSVMGSLVSLMPRRRKDPPDPPLSDALTRQYGDMCDSLLGTSRTLTQFIKDSSKHIGVQLAEDWKLSHNYRLHRNEVCDDDDEEERKESMVDSLVISPSPWKTLEMDAISLSSPLNTLFKQVVELCGRNEGVFRCLLHSFSVWHTRRLSEAFFSVDRCTLQLGSASLLPLSALYHLISSHDYIRCLPFHPLQSAQLDYSEDNMAFVFEEVFLPATPSSSPSSSPSNGSSPTSSTTTPESTLASSPTDTQQPYTESFLERLTDYAEKKESIKEEVCKLSGKEFRLMSECIRSQPLLDERIGEENGNKMGVHLIVLVHGLEGARDDLWPYRSSLKRMLQGRDVQFLCSRINEGSTWGDVEILGKSLLKEMDDHMASLRSCVTRVSFIAHSLGGLIVRAAVARPEGSWLRPRLHTLLTLNTPHLGLVYAKKTSHVGLTLVQWYKRSRCLAQLSLRDTNNFTDSFLVRLASSGSLTPFKNVLLLGSSGDIMVPRHSALLSSCPAADKDRSSLAAAFNHMLDELHKELAEKRVVRYSAVHRKHGEKLRGRPAHTSCVEDSVFIEKLLSTSAINYFY